MTQNATTAKARYEALAAGRQPYLTRGRTAAAVTIPALLPPEGTTGTTQFDDPFQSVGARGVNNLASKLLLALFPPNQSFFRLTLDDFVVQELKAEAGGEMEGEDARAEFDAALGRVERAVLTRLEKMASRTTIYELLRHLIVVGNGLLEIMDEGKLRLHRLTHYAVKRDPAGEPTEIIIKECLSRSNLPPVIAAMVEQPQGEQHNPSAENTVDLYTRIYLNGTSWVVYQEVEGKEVPDSRGSYPKEKCPFIAARWTKIDGEDYGRGMVDEYIGDVTSLEILSQAMVEYAAEASRIVRFVNPSGITSLKTVAEARTGDVVEGDIKDITTLQLDKQFDFQVTKAVADEIEQRLSQAFMLFSSLTRDAERVTAEEIRQLAQELEDSLGGIYSLLAQELQTPLARRIMLVMQRAKELPHLPEEAVNFQVVTGMEALGRNHDMAKLDALVRGIAEAFGPEAVSTWVNVGAYIKRRATALGVDISGIVRSDEEVQATQQQAAQQEMVGQMAGPGLKFINDRMAAGEAAGGM